MKHLRYLKKNNGLIYNTYNDEPSRRRPFFFSLHKQLLSFN